MFAELAISIYPWYLFIFKRKNILKHSTRAQDVPGWEPDGYSTTLLMLNSATTRTVISQ
jgi:hypothetical protein